MRRLTKWLLYALALCAIVVGAIVLAFAIQARYRLTDLRAWHRTILEQEFRAGSTGAPASFPEYRRLEDRLFAELRRRVLEDTAAADTHPLGRFTPGSVPAHLALGTPYNRSFELVPRDPRGAVLLVHGLSDSPYSMRTLADTFFGQGYYVLVLRLPGHGTLPSALRKTTWKDWYAAVTLAARHVAAKAGPGKPFLAGGYSMGGALLTLYSLRTLEDASLPRPDRLYLVSPAIGISRFAVLTNVIAGLSFLPAFEKSQWTDVLPEYDPYKYNSFTVNAANQMYALTRELRSTLLAASEEGRLDRFPRLTVFQSLVDATVTAAEVVNGLLARLPRAGHELVVFDVNRREVMGGLLAPGPLQALDNLRSATDLAFRVTVIGNRDAGTTAVAAFTREVGAREFTREDLPMAWPVGVFSLGHVALPFPPDDPVYGLTPADIPGQPGYHLGNVAAHGESGALLVSLGTFARLRSNPFFDVIRAKVTEPQGQAALVRSIPEERAP